MKKNINSNSEFFRYMRHCTYGTPVIFIIINIFIAFILFTVLTLNIRNDNAFPFEEFSAGITVKNGGIVQNGFVSDTLEKYGAWAMLLDDGGDIIWEYGLPENLCKSYTSSEIAMFSRWYLEDYPVKVWKHELGLLAVGFRPGSDLNNGSFADPRYLSLIIDCIITMLILNFLSVLFLFVHNMRKFEKAVGPILNGIHCLSLGEPFTLEETGKAAYINAELNRTGKILIKKDKSRINWIRGVSHDIRTPLSVIMGYANELENNWSLPDEIREQAGIIRRHGDKLGHLISDLNLAAKLEYGAQSIRRDTIVPAELVRIVVSSVLNAGLPEAFTIEICTDPTAEAPVFTGDSVFIQRMLANLIRNSIAHNPNGCGITVSTEVRGDICFFEVSDTGCGMSKAAMECLNSGESAFEMNTVSESGEHGLGLKIVLKIVEFHDGKISFFNNSPKGLKVKIEFPLNGSRT